MLSASIKSKSHYKQIINKIEKSVPIAMTRVMEKGKETALEKKRGNKDSDSILFEIEFDGKEATGRLYTNFDYAMFLEYGTGTKAEMPHIGHTQAFKNSNYRYWFLPKEVADAKGREFAPQRLINIGGKLYYMMFATQPYPFMRPTAFMLESEAVKIFAEAIKESLRK